MGKSINSLKRVFIVAIFIATFCLHENIDGYTKIQTENLRALKIKKELKRILRPLRNIKKDTPLDVIAQICIVILHDINEYFDTPISIDEAISKMLEELNGNLVIPPKARTDTFRAALHKYNRYLCVINRDFLEDFHPGKHNTSIFHNWEKMTEDEMAFYANSFCGAALICTNNHIAVGKGTFLISQAIWGPFGK